MALSLIWRKLRLYRRFELDIWGLYRLNGRLNKNVRKIFKMLRDERMQRWYQKRSRYIYRIDIMQPSRKKKRRKKRYITYTVAHYFFVTLNYHKFKALAVKAQRKEGFWESNFILLIENRLIGLLYRFQISLNVFNLQFFILNKKIFINKRRVTYCNQAIAPGDVLTFNKNFSKSLRLSMIKRFQLGRYFFTIPRYLFISYKLMFAFVFREPRYNDLAYPLKIIDVYRGLDIK